MKMSYTDYVKRIIEGAKTGDPIYSVEIADAVSAEYGLTKKAAAANTAVALNRLMERDAVPELRNYQKGIYYRTADTPFGEVGINKDRLIADRYMKGDSGYYGGYRLMYQMGLTTQMPNHLTVVTNKAGKNSRKDRRLEITLMPPHTEITKDNKEYLKVLDMLDLMQKAPVDIEKPYIVLAKHIKELLLDYEKLLAYASLYYNQNTLTQLAKVAVEGESLYESA